MKRRVALQKSVVSQALRSEKRQTLFRKTHAEIVEYPPQCRMITVVTFDLRGQRRKKSYYLSLPYMQFIRKGDDLRVSISRTPANLNSMVFFPPFGNIFGDFSVCLNHDRKGLSLDEMIDLWWQTLFDGHTWEGVVNALIPARSYALWEKNSKKDKKYGCKIKWNHRSKILSSLLTMPTRKETLAQIRHGSVNYD